MAVIPLISPIGGLESARPTGDPISRLVMLHRQHRWPTMADSTRSSYAQTFKLIPPHWTHPSVAEVGAWVTWLREKYPPPPGERDSWTVHLHWHNLAAVYSWAKEWGLAAGVNPAAVLGLKKPKSRARAVHDLGAQWPAILGACRDVREVTLLELAKATGARGSELLGLMPHDVVTTTTPWCVRFERQRKAKSWETTALKTDHGVRCLPVSPEAQAGLAELLKLGAPEVRTGLGGGGRQTVGFLFPFRPHELHDLRTRCGQVAPAAFPPGDWLHTLRHTLAVSMLRTGATTDDIQRQLGHDSPTTTQTVYSQFASRPASLDAARAAWRGQAEGPTRWGAPPGAGPPPRVGVAVKGEAPTRPGVRGSRRSKAMSAVQSLNQKSEGSPCSAKSSSGRKQRALPGLSVGPVVSKPRRKR